MANIIMTLLFFAAVWLAYQVYGNPQAGLLDQVNLASMSLSPVRTEKAIAICVVVLLVAAIYLSALARKALKRRRPY